MARRKSSNPNINRCGIPKLTNGRGKRPKHWKREMDATQVKILILSKCDGNCYYCGVELTLKTLTIDHYICKFNGGTDEIKNLVPACSKCNNLKNNYTIKEFRGIFAQHNQGKRRFYAEIHRKTGAERFIQPS